METITSLPGVRGHGRFTFIPDDLEGSSADQPPPDGSVSDAGSDPEGHYASMETDHVTPATGKVGEWVHQTGQSQYVLLDNSTSKETFKSVLESWGYANHKPVFIFLNSDQPEHCDVQWDLMVKTARKAERVDLKLVYIVLGCESSTWPVHCHCNRCEDVPFIRVLYSDEVPDVQGEVDFEVSVSGGVHGANYQLKCSNSDISSGFKEQLHPAICQYMFITQSINNFVSLASSVPHSPLAIVLQGRILKLNEDFMSYVEKLPENRDFERQLYLVTSGDDVRAHGDAMFTPLYSMAPETLFLTLVDLEGSDLLSRKACCQYKEGSLVSSPLPLGQGNERVQYSKQYCLIKCSEKRLQIAVSLFSDFPIYRKIIALELVSDKKDSKQQLDNHFQSTLQSMKCANEEDSSELYLVFDSQARLFDESKTSMASTWSSECERRKCIAFVPLTALKRKLSGWDPDNGLAEQFPLPDWNGFVDMYLFIDDRNSPVVTEGGYFKLSVYQSAMRSLVRASRKPLLTLWAFFVESLNGATSCVRLTDMVEEHSSFSATMFPFTTECLPLAYALIRLLTTQYNQTTHIGCSPDQFTKALKSFSMTNTPHEAVILTRLALSLLKTHDRKQSDYRGEETRELWAAVAEAIRPVLYHWVGREGKHKHRYRQLVQVLMHYILVADPGLGGTLQQHTVLNLRHPRIQSVLSVQLPHLNIDASTFTNVYHEPVVTDLFLLAVLGGNIVATEELLRCRPPRIIVILALFAVGVLKHALSKSSSEKGLLAINASRESLQDATVNLESQAKGLVHDMYLQSKEVSKGVLFEKHKRFDNHNAFDLACMSESRSFLCDPACADAIYDTWWEDMVVTPWWKILLFILLPELADLLDMEATQCLPFNLDWMALKMYRIPAIKCMVHYLSFMYFLILFTHLILTGIEDKFSGLEFVIFVWMASLLLEEIRQIMKAYQHTPGQNIRNMVSAYLSEFWNILDLTLLCIIFHWVPNTDPWTSCIPAESYCCRSLPILPCCHCAVREKPTFLLHA